MRKLFGLVAVALMLALPTPASAHGELESAIPAPDSTVAKPPNHMIINFTEPPSKDAVFNVVDGCGTELIDEEKTVVEGRVGHIYLDEGGQPGEWKVSYKIVSSVDGHPTKDSYSVTVKGKKDCSADPAGDGGGDGGVDTTDDAGPTSGGGDEGSSFPVVPVAIGTVVVVGLAFLVRRAVA